jgi:hypothetical protein
METNGRRHFGRFTVIPTEIRHGEEVAHSVLGFNKVWFTRHALLRMKQRHISQTDVFLVLEEPIQKGLKTQPGRYRWRRGTVHHRAIDVVFEKWPDKVCIVTVIVL